MTFPLPNANPVWKHFQILCSIPRPSKHEATLREHLRAWAEQRGLATRIDSAGNLIIRKAATPGMASRRTVVMQGHLDMVCQANAGTEHDFHADPIRPVLKDGWLVAEHTTLGADNGIGVSFALAVLESADIPHGPLEVLFTLDEEAGMGGALGLDTDVLSGDLLINIDTEDWGEFYLGCAGGIDVNAHAHYAEEPVPAGYMGLKLSIKGLRGGHSGVNIHQERGSAIKLMVRLLRKLEGLTDLRLARFEGGTARNALAREAMAVVTIPDGDLAKVEALLAQYQALYRQELVGIDEGVLIGQEPAAVSKLMAPADQARILGVLHAAPHGVKRQSLRVPGVVETSNNMGVVRIAEGEFSVNFMVRSLLDSGTAQLADEIESLFSLIGVQVEREGGYPGWAPNPDSRLLALFQEVYAREFSATAEVKVIHAGLECGILGAKYPAMDMVSFGPNIRGAHAPGERVEVESVEKAWKLLKAVLKAIPEKECPERV
ncbi:MAG: aminoacyl-histidine dipeptidase [Gammaproteobacteria bacterium]|nr:aminoacyl-histidine dipeptidase [Gammaproteobacteria bacterium]